MVTDTDIKANIILEVGDTIDSRLANNIDRLWNSYADKAFVAPRLQELYVHRACIEVVLASPEIRNAVSFSMSGDLSQRLGERRDALALRRREVQAEIEHVQSWERQLQPPVLESIKATEIEVPPALRTAPPPPVLDANDPRYRGDVYDQSGRTRVGQF